MTPLPAFARALCDDAAVFPPGLAPLTDAVRAHRAHRASTYRELVGPLVLPESALAELAALLDSPDQLELAVTAPDGPDQVISAAQRARELPVTVTVFEVAVPTGMAVSEFFSALDRACAWAPAATAYVEVPRDQRRPEVIAALATSGHRAKFRTGGVRADLYPDDNELAAAIAAVVDAGVPFKATAGLHHAIRDTDPRTGFDQHGFLNLLLTTDAALAGRSKDHLIGVLGERDKDTLADAVRGLDDDRATAVRRTFVSFGTCSITEPLNELVELGLVAEPAASGEGAIP